LELVPPRTCSAQWPCSPDKPPYGQSYYVSQFSSDEMSGTLTMGAMPMSATGAPLPIGTKGRFQWVHLAVRAATKSPEVGAENKGRTATPKAN